MKITSLSPSMVNTYLKCSQQSLYRDVLRLAGPSTPVLTFGTAFHRTIEEDMYQKVKSGKNLPLDLLQDFIAEEIEYSETEWKEQTLNETKDQAVITLAEYQTKIASSIDPIDVEWAFSIDVIGRDYRIAGKADIINAVGAAVIETKTTGKRRSAPWPDQMFQVWVYMMAWTRKNKSLRQQARVDYALRGKAETLSFPISYDSSLEKRILTTFDSVANGIQREVWIPNRYHFLCCRKYCQYWNQCEKDCGGRVKD